MSKDLVKRLRADMTGIGCNWLPLMREAADLIEAQEAEIERLKAEVKWREDETAHEVVAARDCEKYERKRAEAAERKRLR